MNRPINHNEDTLSIDAQLQVETICDQFEAAWDDNVAPSLRQYIKRLKEEVPDRVQRFGMTQLAMVDMEFRWREAAGQSLRKMPHDSIPPLPRISDYIAEFPGLGPLETALEDLVGLEYRLRKMTGENISRAQFEKNFSSHANLSSRLQRIDTELSVDTRRSKKRSVRELQIRCPHCHSTMALKSDSDLAEVVCDQCGGNFCLAPKGMETQTARTLENIGHFELIDRLGVGSFGTVWKARDTELDRTVAIKVPRQGELDAATEEQFLREARVAAKLKHPNIVTIFEVGREDNTVYIVSDLIRGLTLSDWLTAKRPSFRESAQICETAARALDYAHRMGVVHRDLKPSNILMNEDGQPHVMDFGLAKRDAGDVTMTMDGQVLGTPAYMSPEQAQGDSHQADQRSDVYSLGVIFYQLLTGELPFRGNVRMLIHQMIHDQPLAPRKLNSNIPRDLETICLRCLEKKPRDRFASAADLADELGRFGRSEPILSRPLSAPRRAWRWCQRNPFQASTAGLLLCLALAGPAVAMLQHQLRAEAVREGERATVALQDAKIARAQAEKMATANRVLAEEANQGREEAEYVRKELIKILRSPDPSRDGRTVTVAERLAAAVASLSKLSTENVDQNQGMTLRARGDLLIAIAETFSNLGLMEDSLGAYQAASQILESAGDEDGARLKTLDAQLGIANSYGSLGHYITARELAKELAEKAYSHDLPEDHKIVQGANRILSQASFRIGEFQINRRPFIAAITNELSQLKTNLEIQGADTVAMVGASADMALKLIEIGDLAEAKALLDPALRGIEKHFAPSHTSVFGGQIQAAILQRKSGSPEKAVATLKKVTLELSEFPNYRWHSLAYQGLRELAKAQEAAGLWDDAGDTHGEIIHRVTTFNEKITHRENKAFQSQLQRYYEANLAYAQVVKKKAPVLVAKDGASPIWMDAKTILFATSDQQVVKMDLATKETKGVLESGEQLAYSPASQLLAYVIAEQDAFRDEIWIHDLSTGQSDRITRGGTPCWSADGKVLYYHNRGKNRLEAIDVERSNAGLDVGRGMIAQHAIAAHSARMSPNGESVAHHFGFCVAITRSGSDAPMRSVIFGHEADHVMPWLSSTAPVAELAWSADSRYVAVGSVWPGADEGICIIDTERGRFMRILGDSFTAPSWSPDRKQLVLEKRECQGSSIYMLQLPNLDAAIESLGQPTEPIKFTSN